MNDWREGFKRALIDVVYTKGAPLRSDPSYYGGWQEWNPGPIRDYVDSVGIDYAATPMPDVSSWNEFMGTFYPDKRDEARHGVDAHLVLLDGQKVAFRIETDLSDLIQQIANMEQS